MKLMQAFFRLIRWPNLVFIVLTQCLFRTCILATSVPHFYTSDLLVADTLNFICLVLASVCIAAAGYIINDYFDLNIDRVNKPKRNVIDRTIKRRWAIVWHLVLSGMGILLSLYIGWRTRSVILPVGNVSAVFLLWVYSTTFKRKVLSGNIIIAVLTAWVVLVLCADDWYRIPLGWAAPIATPIGKIIRLAFFYGGFAFIISLVREVVKDIEDMEGDARYGCRTMPIAWGIPVSKVFTAVWIVVLIVILCIVQFYSLQFGWWISALYGLMSIILPLGWILFRLYHAQQPADYHRLSTAIKGVMLTGILSMVFFLFYH
jgi:4-hydroxybenzoate polyprenyltransferase